MLLPFIKKVNNVPGDGHCAYYAASQALCQILGVPGKGAKYKLKDAWFKVRKEVRCELVTSPSPVWAKFLRDDYEMVKSNVLVESVRAPAGRDKWLDPVFLGFPLANAFGRPVLKVSKDQSSTYLPLCTGPGKLLNLAWIVMAFVQGNHLVEVESDDEGGVP